MGGAPASHARTSHKHGAVLTLTLYLQGVWDQIDMNVLPVQCSYNACGRCFKYGQFPCAWYKVLFIIVGLVRLMTVPGPVALRVR
jgi:hypothetical protein